MIVHVLWHHTCLHVCSSYDTVIPNGFQRCPNGFEEHKMVKIQSWVLKNVRNLVRNHGCPAEVDGIPPRRPYPSQPPPNWNIVNLVIWDGFGAGLGTIFASTPILRPVVSRPSDGVRQKTWYLGVAESPGLSIKTGRIAIRSKTKKLSQKSNFFCTNFQIYPL